MTTEQPAAGEALDEDSDEWNNIRTRIIINEIIIDICTTEKQLSS